MCVPSATATKTESYLTTRQGSSPPWGTWVGIVMTVADCAAKVRELPASQCSHRFFHLAEFKVRLMCFLQDIASLDFSHPSHTDACVLYKNCAGETRPRRIPAPPLLCSLVAPQLSGNLVSCLVLLPTSAPSNLPPTLQRSPGAVHIDMIHTQGPLTKTTPFPFSVAVPCR